MINKLDKKGCTIIDTEKGDNWMRYYPNSIFGRSTIASDYPTIADEIIGVRKAWGTEPYYD